MTPGDPPARPARRGRRILLRILGLLALSALLVELALRLILFVDVPGLRKVTLQLRQANNFFEKREPGFWTTSVAFTPTDRLKPIPAFDPLVGWAGSRVEPGTYRHRDENALAGRRPVLLFGDSFAECVTPPQECWQGLLNRSEFGRTHFLLNYGVGGYGLDQSVLMLRAGLDAYREQDPIVILSVFVDDDLQRMLLPFRGWPKPRFEVEDGRLIEPGPVPEGVEAFLDEQAPFVWSWAWRYVARRGADEQAGAADDRARIEELTPLLLAALKLDLEREGVTWFVVLFQGDSLLTPEGREDAWEHDFLARTLRELGIPYVSMRRELIEHATKPGASPKQLFIQGGPGAGHYSAAGNAAVFPALLRGLRGEFD